MCTKAFTISSAGLKNVIFTTGSNSIIIRPISSNNDNHTQDNFRFIFGDQEIIMNRFFADFISPRVSSIHQSDPTIDTLEIRDNRNTNKQTKETLFTTDLLENFKKISSGYSIEIDEEMSQKLRLLSVFLGNEEIYNKINELFQKKDDDSNIKEYLNYLKYIDDIDYTPSFYKDSIIDNISSHFYSIEKVQLFDLSKPIIYSILSNDNLKVSNEDSLFDFINEFLSEHQNESDRILFYEKVDISKLSEEKLKEFVFNIEADQMTNSMWQKIRDFICEKSHTNFKENEKIEKIEFDNNPKNRFKGIISHLGNGNPKKLVDDGIINITSSEAIDISWMPKNVINYDNDKVGFDSTNKPNSWLCIDFKEKKLKPSHYSIQSVNNGGKNHLHLKNWCIEGSNDGNNWVILDERKNEECLNDNSASNTFDVQHNFEQNEFYQFLRIRQTGLNWYSNCYNNQLFFSSIEFFGSLLKF